jgi:hypothetical protein
MRFRFEAITGDAVHLPAAVQPLILSVSSLPPRVNPAADTATPGPGDKRFGLE